MELIKKMVLSFPLACLPLGSLTKIQNVKAFKTMFNGLDMLLTHKFHPR